MKRFKTICAYSNSDRISEMLLKWVENNGFEILDTKLDSQYMQGGWNSSSQVGSMTVIYEDGGKPIVFDYGDLHHGICKKCNTKLGYKNNKEIEFKDHVCETTSNRVQCPRCGINYLNLNPTINKEGQYCSTCWASLVVD